MKYGEHIKLPKPTLPKHMFNPGFLWWAMKHWVGFEDRTQQESNDVTEMLCMGGEL